MICNRQYTHTITPVLIFCSVLIAFCGQLAKAIEATTYPASKTIVVGGLEHFECNILEPSGSNQILQWYIEWDDDVEPRLLDVTDKGTIDKSERPEFNGRGSYQLQYFKSVRTDGFDNHNCIIVIHGATLKDNGYIGCSHQSAGEEPTLFRAAPARLTVVPQPTKNPECNVNKHEDVFVLTCVSYHGDPQAHLTWFEGTQMKSPTIQTFNSLEIAVRNDNVEKVITCKAVQQNVDVGSCSVTLDGQTAMADNGFIQAVTTATSTTMIARTGNQGKSSNTGGIVAGVLTVIIIVVLVIFWLLWYRRKRDEADKPNKNLAFSPHVSGYTTSSTPQNQDDMAPYGVYEATSNLSHAGSHVYETADEPGQSSNQTDNDLYVIHSVNNV